MHRIAFMAMIFSAAIACGTSNATPAPKDAEAAESALRTAIANPSNWATHGHDYTNQRFSPLTQITTANVESLSLAWRYHTNIPRAFETTPLVIDSVMYITTPLNHVVALNAATGARKWEYTHDLHTTDHCCGPVNRGVAYYGGRLYMGTLDARLVALDARTGHREWDVTVGDNTGGYSITAAPVAVKGLVITGVSGGEYGIRGYVSAYDAATGELRWRWYTIRSPADGGWWGHFAENDPFGTPLHRDIARERRDSSRYAEAWKTGGAPMWQTPAVDLKRNLLIFATGNVSPDVDGSVRPGDNLYGNSIVALDLTTGKLKWYQQLIPHDVWDLDLASPVILMDVKDATGRVIPAVAEAGKSGWVYVLNRETGNPIRKSDPFTAHQNVFTPPTELGTRTQGGAAFGGSEWSPTAFSPQTGFMYVLGVEEPLIYKVRHEQRIPGAWYVGGAYYAARGVNQGSVTAVDLNTGKIAWQRGMPKQMVGGALATASNLVFVGSSDQHMMAFDARTGRQLWSYLTFAGVNAPPITYSVNGRQYLAVAAGGNWVIDSARGDELLVFTLGRPEPGEPGAKPPKPPQSTRH